MAVAINSSKPVEKTDKAEKTKAPKESKFKKQ